MEKFLPVQREGGGSSSTDGASFVWPESVKFALLALSKGPGSSQVANGETLYDSIQDMQRESGLPHLHMSKRTADGLCLFFDDLLSHTAAQRFFQHMLPNIAKLALSLPLLLGNQHEILVKHFSMYQAGNDQFGSAELGPTMVLRLLRRQHPGMVILSQETVASLLACSFFCLFPSADRDREHLPYVNFDRLFAGVYEKGESNEHKLLCLLHYFERVCSNMPQGVVSYERKLIPAQKLKDGNAFWSGSSVPLCPLTIIADGAIEDLGQDFLQVDFANRMLGGGALSTGCVQEEIRFMINPELIAGMIFLPAMDANESIEVVGAERYSCYKGYASSFRFAGDFQDSSPRDGWGRRLTRIVAIDALYQPGDDQYRLTHSLRELNKAFCGFLDTASLRGGGTHRDGTPYTPPGVRCSMGIATGNWGCGVFGGSLELKSLLQWLAASQARRPSMLYFSFQNPDAQRLQEVANWILQEGWPVGELWSVITEYGQKRHYNVNLFDWILPQPGTDLESRRARKYCLDEPEI